MSRYIDEISARESFQDVLAYMGSEVKRMLKKVPTADVVEVVRCKDCKYCFRYIRPNYERYECEYKGCSDEAVDYVDPTHYCSYGERKEENEG